MVKQTLQTIKVDKILANFSQPREHFDKEKVKELAESILSNGLINPITVRADPKRKGKFMIVAGERRWQAHRLAKLKKIDAFVKEYKEDVDWQIESLVENWQRENLNSTERENFTLQIWKTDKFKTQGELAHRLGAKESSVSDLISAAEDRKRLKIKTSTRSIIDTQTLQDKDRKRLLTKVDKKEIESDKLREYTRTIKVAPEEVKEALLDDKINVEQAERISKLKTETQRENAIQEHKNLAKVEKTVERNIEHQQTAKEKRDIEKRGIQINNMILSFKNSVSDVRISLDKSLKILLVNTKLVELMDEKQKEKFDTQLDRLVESIERGEHIAEQIKGKL